MAKNLFDISSKIIVVTGSSGILGRQYVETLLESGAKVCGLDIGSNSINEAHKKKFPNKKNRQFTGSRLLSNFWLYAK